MSAVSGINQFTPPNPPSSEVNRYFHIDLSEEAKTSASLKKVFKVLKIASIVAFVAASIIGVVVFGIYTPTYLPIYLTTVSLGVLPLYDEMIYRRLSNAQDEATYRYKLDTRIRDLWNQNTHPRAPAVPSVEEQLRDLSIFPGSRHRDQIDQFRETQNDPNLEKYKPVLARYKYFQQRALKYREKQQDLKEKIQEKKSTIQNITTQIFEKQSYLRDATTPRERKTYTKELSKLQKEQTETSNAIKKLCLKHHKNSEKENAAKIMAAYLVKVLSEPFNTKTLQDHGKRIVLPFEDRQLQQVYDQGNNPFFIRFSDGAEYSKEYVERSSIYHLAKTIFEANI